MTALGSGRALLLAVALAATGALAAAGAAPPARAQTIGGVTGEGPIEITAQESIEWLSAEQRYLARGGARAQRGDVAVNADLLSADYRENAAGETEIYRLEATGNVVIETPEERVTGDLGVYDVESQVLTITGEDLRLTTPRETLIADDSLEYDRLARRATARGNATVWNDRDTVSADTLIAELNDNASGNLELARVFGQGNVVIVTPQETVRGDEGMYDLREERATIAGNVRITRGENQLNGAIAEVDLATGVSRLLSGEEGTVRARGLLTKEDAGSE